MLSNRFRNSTYQPPTESEIPIIPDPWETSSETLITQPPAQKKTILPEIHPLIAAANEPYPLQLTSDHCNLAWMLLQDWLKLKTQDAKILATQLSNALALLFYLEDQNYDWTVT
jgi:hypothetical protein